ncbi:hypothetical protein [Arthrobacter sp. NA-172]
MASFTLDGSRTRTPNAGTRPTYKHAERWNQTHAQARWQDDDRRPQ